MTLISTLLALLFERILPAGSGLRFDLWMGRLWQRRGWDSNGLGLIIMLLPGILLWALLSGMPDLYQILLSVIILGLCLGCPGYKRVYKDYLEAVGRGDEQACVHYSDALGVRCDGEKPIETVGQTLIWRNYQYFAAVIVLFVIGGAPLVLIYASVREVARLERDKDTSMAKLILGILDWIPARITALGYLVVGHFNHAFPVWLKYLLDVASHPRVILAEVALAAEDSNKSAERCVNEPACMVRLAKRNVLFFLTLIALASLAGWVH